MEDTAVSSAGLGTRSASRSRRRPPFTPRQSHHADPSPSAHTRRDATAPSARLGTRRRPLLQAPRRAANRRQASPEQRNTWSSFPLLLKPSLAPFHPLPR